MKILVVDDQVENLYLLERLLKKNNHEVITSKNGKEAFQILETDSIEMIISDILMPVMDGYQLCHDVRNDERFKELPFIFYTATYVDKEDEAFALKLGADRFIRKPMEPDRFLGIIDLLISEKLSGNLTANHDTLKDEKEVYKLYNERLVNKLEDKIKSLEIEVTKRKHAQEQIQKDLKEKEILLKEVHHRVKNNLQIISSLLRLQAGQVHDVLLTSNYTIIQNRIQSMTLVYELAYQSEDFSQLNFGKYCQYLIKGIFRSYKTDPDSLRVQVDVDDTPIAVDLAIPLGMIINELVSNSLRYAFSESFQGEPFIHIEMKQLANKWMMLKVRDNGIGFNKDDDLEKPQCMGLHLVTILAEEQLKGKMHFSHEHGAEFTVQFKV